MKRMLLPGVLIFKLLLASFFFLIVSPQRVYAVTITISNVPSSITSESFTITASVSGATTGTNYLRIDLFKDQTSNYFGETYNGSDWYGSSTYTQYLPITIVSGTFWSGTMQGRFGSPSSGDYDGAGTYKMRIRRYTSGGGTTTSEANASAVTVAIAIPTSTPTLAPATPTPTASPPTNTPTPIKTPTPTPSNTPTPTPSLKPTLTATPSVSISVVLGQATNSATITPEAPSPTVEVLGSYGDNTGKVLMGIGLLLLAGCGILVFRMYKRGDRLFI